MSVLENADGAGAVTGDGCLRVHPLYRLFNPRSVAVVGASSNPAKVGHRICRQLIAEGFKGELVPISLREGEIAGVQSKPSLRAHDGDIDVVVITTATGQVADALRDCVAMRIPFAIIHTAGFAETGTEGKALEDDLVAIARDGGVRLIGPNCMQMINKPANLNLVGTPFPSGRIGMISQSGNLVRAATEEFLENGLGFSSFVTVGNQADLKIHDYLDYFKDDSDTDLVLIYVEGIVAGTGAKLVAAAREVVKRKPVVLLKGGVTDAGSRSSVSHTGSLAGEARVFTAAMQQAGVILLDRLDEMVPVVDALSRLPLPDGPRVGVVGGGGGHATICADAIERAGLEVPVLSDATQKNVSEHLPPRAGIRNPIDFTGGSEREIAVYAKIPEIVLEQDADAALLYGLYAGYRTDLEYPGNTYVETSTLIVDMVRRLRKPAIMQTVYARQNHPSLDVLRRGGVPVMASVEHAAAGLSALWRYAENRRRLARLPDDPGPPMHIAPEFASLARSRPALNLTESESFQLLAACGLPLIPHRIVENIDEAEAAAKALGFPVVLKGLDPNLIHKTDAGGVALDLRDLEAVRDAYDQVSAATGGKKAVAASYMPGGRELIVGAYRDPTFGPVVLFGLGGTAVEALDDVCLRVLPVRREEVEGMLDAIHGHRLLGPLRGKPGIDREAVVEILITVAALMEANPEIAEIDLNPVLAFPQGAFVADARILFTTRVEEVEVG